MATIKTAIQIQDKMTSVVHSMNTSLKIMLNTFENVQNATDKSINTSAFQTARNELSNASVELNRVESELNRVKSENNNLNNGIEATSRKLQNATSSSNAFFNSLLQMSIIQKTLNLVQNQIGAAMNRMDTMTNFDRTMTAITGSSDAAQASLNELKNITKGTAYGLDVAAQATQNFVTRGMGIATATKEVGKWADAVAFYGNGTNEQLTSVTDALGKMLSKGKVEMDQLNRLTDAGINAVGIYAQATGKSASTVQKNLTSGKISSYDFITTVSSAFEEGKNGVLNISGAAKEAGGTWANSIANMKAAVTRGIISVINGIDSGLSGSGFGTILGGIKNFGNAMENILNNIGSLAGKVIKVLSPLLHLIQQTAVFVSSNWSIIAPIVTGIAVAFGLYNAALAAHAIYVGISTAAEWLHSIATYAQAQALLANVNANLLATSSEYALAVATAQATVAQAGLNTALLACPLTWIVVGIIAVIAAVYACVAAYNKWTNSTVSATGLIMGYIYTLAAYWYNRFIVPIWNALAALANFFANVFNDPCTATKVLFYDLATTVLGYIETMAKGIEDVINKIPGVSVDITSGLSNFRSELERAAQEAKDQGEWVEVVGKLDYWDYSDAFSAGYNKGSQIESNIANFNMNDLMSKYTPDLSSIGDIGGNIGNIADDTSGIKKSLDVSEEDLKYLRDLAEQETINRFTTAEIKIDMTNNNNINNNDDVDGIIDMFEEKLYEAMESVAEGVHE